MRYHKHYHYIYISLASFFVIFALVNMGCLEKGEIVNVSPNTTEYELTLDINKYITLQGQFTDGNPGASSTPYDLNFFYLGTSEVIGLRGGYYDLDGVRTYLKVSDLGAIKYETVDSVPEISAYDSFYKNVNTSVIYSTDTDGVTLLKLDHVYSIYKWTPQGGNYAKIIIDFIDTLNGWVKVRSVYQQRQGYNKFY